MGRDLATLYFSPSISHLPCLALCVVLPCPPAKPASSASVIERSKLPTIPGSPQSSSAADAPTMLLTLRCSCPPSQARYFRLM